MSETKSDKGMTLVSYWTVKCVTCGRDAAEESGYRWPDQAHAREDAKDYDYVRVEGSWYCDEHAPEVVVS